MTSSVASQPLHRALGLTDGELARIESLLEREPVDGGRGIAGGDQRLPGQVRAEGLVQEPQVVACGRRDEEPGLPGEPEEQGRRVACAGFLHEGQQVPSAHGR